MPDPIVILSRVLHVLGAIVLLGGAICIRYVFFPAIAPLPSEEQESLKGNLTRRWKPFVHGGITVLFLTGFYNYFVAMGSHKGDGPYHMLMGIKILLAMFVFFVVSVLPGRIPAFAGMRRNLKTWLSMTILCSIVIVVIAGFLKIRGTPETPVAEISIIETPAMETETHP